MNKQDKETKNTKTLAAFLLLKIICQANIIESNKKYL